MKAFAVFKNKTFTKMFIASFASRMGSVIGMSAFTLYLLHRFSTQPFYATLTEMMYSLPTLFLFFIVGVVADRLDRQRITINSDWIRAVLSFGLIGALWLGWIPTIFLILFLRESVSKFFVPAESAIVQGVLSKEHYQVAAGLNQMTNSLFNLFGSGLGIITYWTVGIQGAILVDAISFIVSALLITSCKLSKEARLPNGPHKVKDLNARFVLQDFKAGIRYIVSNKLLLSIVVGFILFGVVNGGFSVMPIYILKYKLAPTSYEAMTIWLGVVFGGGLLIGSVLATMVGTKIKMHWMISVGVLFSGVFTFLASLMTNLILFFTMIFLLSLVLPFINVAIGGWLPSIVSQTMMGRVQGCVDPLMMFSQTLTLGGIAIMFPAVLSINELFWVVGGCLVAVGLYYIIILPKQARKYDDSQQADDLLVKMAAITED
ncbi:MFS transporter [Pullulanibacillus sp. KACC 23026]|uniref:MFS transporter n=1 Tax=Pullulanibacillus sp. KACC 23026 TaxID=3028315 RepID=UPI0023B06ECD|nr:MFS transporter [Pullulanibacillus sp. KACC 23026]WEG14410.1 MFS transporter [Pullulanibacillus sp. KACC 23026]